MRIVNKQKLFVNLLTLHKKTLDFFLKVCYNFIRIVINSAKVERLGFQLAVSL